MKCLIALAVLLAPIPVFACDDIKGELKRMNDIKEREIRQERFDSRSNRSKD